jgi:hypothetical protein
LKKCKTESACQAIVPLLSNEAAQLFYPKMKTGSAAKSLLKQRVEAIQKAKAEERARVELNWDKLRIGMSLAEVQELLGIHVFDEDIKAMEEFKKTMMNGTGIEVFNGPSLRFTSHDPYYVITFNDGRLTSFLK